MPFTITQWYLHFNDIHITLYRIYQKYLHHFKLSIVLDHPSTYSSYQFDLPILSSQMTAFLKQIFLHDFSNPVIELKLRSSYPNLINYFEDVAKYIKTKVKEEKLKKFDYEKEIEELKNNNNISIKR